MPIPRNFFPNMPDEVFEMWLEPIAEHYGWPFVKPDESTKGTKWAKIFGDFDLKYWTLFHWRFIEIPITPDIIYDFSMFRIESIIKWCVHGVPTLIAGVADTKERFWACADFVRNNSGIPGFIIACLRNGQLEIVDGNHRIASLFHVGAPEDYKVPVWMPYIKNIPQQNNVTR